MVAIGFSSLKHGVAASAVLCGVLTGCASTEQQTSKAELSPTPSTVQLPNSATALNAPQPGSVPGVATAGTTQPQTEAALAKTGRVQPGQAAAGQVQATAGQIQVAAGQAQVPGVQTPEQQAATLQSAQQRMMQPVAGQPQVANQGQMAIAAVTGAGAANTSAAAAYAASDEPPVPTVVAIPIPNPSRPGEVALMQPLGSSLPTDQSAIPLTPEMVAIQSVIPTPRPGESQSLPATELAFAAPAPQIAYASAQPHYDFNFDTSGPTIVPAVMTFENDTSDVSPAEKSYITKLIDKYAKLYEVPAELIHRVVHRESRYNPKAYSSSGYFGLMQIKYNTAKSMGYEGPPSGLFDAETNIKYAAKYLRGAWMVADNKQDDAVSLYAHGYYYNAKRKGLTDIANGDY